MMIEVREVDVSEPAKGLPQEVSLVFKRLDASWRMLRDRLPKDPAGIDWGLTTSGDYVSVTLHRYTLKQPSTAHLVKLGLEFASLLTHVSQRFQPLDRLIIFQSDCVYSDRGAVPDTAYLGAAVQLKG